MELTVVCSSLQKKKKKKKILFVTFTDFLGINTYTMANFKKATMRPKKKERKKLNSEWLLVLEGRGRRNGEMLVKGYKLSVIRLTSF